MSYPIIETPDGVIDFSRMSEIVNQRLDRQEAYSKSPEGIAKAAEYQASRAAARAAAQTPKPSRNEDGSSPHDVKNIAVTPSKPAIFGAFGSPEGITLGPF